MPLLLQELQSVDGPYTTPRAFDIAMLERLANAGALTFPYTSTVTYRDSTISTTLPLMSPVPDEEDNWTPSVGTDSPSRLTPDVYGDSYNLLIGTHAFDHVEGAIYYIIGGVLICLIGLCGLCCCKYSLCNFCYKFGFY